MLSKITNLGSDRYVKSFVRVQLNLNPGRTVLTTEKEKEAFKLLQECGRLVEAAVDHYPVLKELDERIYISVRDLNDLHFTATVKDGGVKVNIGWDVSKRPTLIVPLFQFSLLHLKQILTDTKVDKKELYRIARVLFVPFMRGLYDADYLYTSGDKRYLKLDNIFHVEMLGIEGVVVDGFPGNAQATVANVNGEWIVFEGFQGTPRMKVTCKLDEALEYYYVLMVQMKKAKDMQSLKQAFGRYMALRQKTIVDFYGKEK